MEVSNRLSDPLMRAIMAEAKQQGKSWLNLAIDANVAYSTLCVNAVGKTSPRLRTLRSLLDAIDCDVILVRKDTHQD